MDSKGNVEFGSYCSSIPYSTFHDPDRDTEGKDTTEVKGKSNP